MEKLKVSHPGGPIRARISIGGSKSISNRVLILNALADKSSSISNLSDSDDTSTLQKLLDSNSEILDAHHAGTTFRFMTAFLCLQKESRTLTGSDRMKQRPIGPLVDALRELGADIAYLENEGYPPLRIAGNLVQKQKEIAIRSDMSSQYLSALCMIAPVLPQGLIINLEGDLVSKPYLEMTLKLMSAFGVQSTFENNVITISPQQYISQPFVVESDWSSASYMFAIAAVAADVEIELDYFKSESTQADSVIQEFSEEFGVVSELENNVLSIRSTASHAQLMEHDFITHPDIAQTIAGIAGAKKITVKYKGLRTLAIKETDRVAALTTELSKVGVDITEDKTGDYEYIQEGVASVDLPCFHTYQDHRMAMALAPLAILGAIEIENPKVVNKSYPNFWKDLATLGFVLEDIKV